MGLSKASLQKGSAGKKASPQADMAVAFVQTSVRTPHTASAKRFERYKMARTLGEARALGALPSDLRDDFRRGVLHRAIKLRDWSILRTIQLFAPSDEKPIAFAPNLKRPNSKAWQRYQSYSKAKTLGEAKRFGIWPGDVANDISKGFLGSDKTPWEAMALKGWKSLMKKSAESGKSSKTKASRAKEASRASKDKEKDRQRNAERRAARASARAEWASLGTAAVRPLAWSRKRGWTDVDGTSCLKSKPSCLKSKSSCLKSKA